MYVYMWSLAMKYFSYKQEVWTWYGHGSLDLWYGLGSLDPQDQVSPDEKMHGWEDEIQPLL